ncbi:MAG: hypothetical protein AMXMBFR34_03750 [Myxococcaceae bacterium]
MLRALCAVLAVGVLGCPKEEQPFDPSTDRTLQKLKEEQDRLAKGGAPSGPPGKKTPEPDPLAEAAAAQAPPRVLALPPAAVTKLGPLNLELRRVEVSQTLKTTRASISTGERFVRVVLTATTRTRAPLSLSGARLERGAETASIAGDVQRLGQGSPLETAIEPGVEQDLVLFFEASPSMIAPGLKIILPSGEKTVELPLQ